MLRQSEGKARAHLRKHLLPVPYTLSYSQAFDCLQLRVLATRASAGGVSLWQARGPDACLCIGSGDCEPAGSHSKLDIQPGFFKYGWYAEPQRFAVAVSQSVTTAAASAALKAMEGITMAPKPPDLKRHSTNSVADVSSQSTDFAFRPASVVTSSVKTASAPIAIGSFRNSSNDDSLGSSMYTDTVLEGSGSVTSDTSMFTTKTNKTRRGKRGGKKQRESSMKFRMQSVSTPASPMQVSVLLCTTSITCVCCSYSPIVSLSSHKTPCRISDAVLSSGSQGVAVSKLLVCVHHVSLILPLPAVLIAWAIATCLHACCLSLSATTCTWDHGCMIKLLTLTCRYPVHVGPRQTGGAGGAALPLTRLPLL